MTMHLRLGDFTWTELAEVARGRVVALIPAGTVEQHGPHLPLDTDVRIATAFAEAAAAQAEPGTALVTPPVCFGLSAHLADFPGALHQSPSVFVSAAAELAVCLARMGLERVLFVNGHGSNSSAIDVATKQALAMEPHGQYASVSWWELEKVRRVASDARVDSVASHACAFETSLMLAIAPESVRLDLAEAGQEFPSSAHIWRDTFGRRPQATSQNPIKLTESWSSWSNNGVRGDPRRATETLGQEMLRAGTEELAAVVAELVERDLMLPRRGPRGELISQQPPAM